MSTARLILAALAAHPGPARVQLVSGDLHGQTNPAYPLRSLEELGLVRHCGYRMWEATQRGRDVVDGRAEVRTKSRCWRDGSIGGRARRENDHGTGRGRYVAATWLASLPRGISITSTGFSPD